MKANHRQPDQTRLGLLKIPGCRLQLEDARELVAAIRAGDPSQYFADVLCSTTTDESYVYFKQAAAIPAAVTGRFPGAQIVHLERLLTLDGPSAGHAAPFHYIVETDVASEAEADMNLWYNVEHLPGLAAVPGNVRASRYASDGASPRYYACYDLLDPSVRQHSAWIAVTETGWSSRVRPQFRNTKRTVFQRVFLSRDDL